MPRSNRPRSTRPAVRVEVRLNDRERELVKTIQKLTEGATGKTPSASAVVAELVAKYAARHLASIATRGRTPPATSPVVPPAKTYENREAYLADHPDYLEEHIKRSRARTAAMDKLMDRIASAPQQ